MINVFWVGNLGKIGGVETFIYELAKRYCDYDLIILYHNIDIEQLTRLKRYVKCIKYNGEHVKCKRFFCNYDISIIDNVEAEEYIHIIHCVFSHNELKPHTHNKINKYYAVSKEACESFMEITKEHCEVLHNPLNIDKPRRVLKLISATRIAKDKGKLEYRMLKLANELEINNIPFIWLVFTNSEQKSENKNIIYLKPTLDIRNYIASSDYLVQLSDTEAYCYSVLESLCLNVPVIVTDIPCFKEMGIENKKNGYILDFDMTNIPIYDIYNNVPTFNYSYDNNKWDSLIIKEKSDYKEKNMMIKVRANEKFENIKDVETNSYHKKGDVWETTKERAEYLKEHGVIEILEDNIEKEDKKIIKENKTKKTKKKTSK